MNNYIKLDSVNPPVKRYKVLHEGYSDVDNVPRQHRGTIAGKSDVTHGVAFRRWEMTLLVPHAGVDDWGGIGDLRSLYEVANSVYFTDHFGVQRTVTMLEELRPESLTPVLDGTPNKYKVRVTLQVVN